MLNKKREDSESELNDVPTLSIVVPSSIIDTAQSRELKSYLVGQVARAASIFKVGEIIVYMDNKDLEKNYTRFFVRNLQYLETPQYLRKALIPLNDDLQNAGLMNPLECDHHLKIDEWCPYRDGVTLDRPTKKDDTAWVNIGLRKDCLITNAAGLKNDENKKDKVRLTVKLNEERFDHNIRSFILNRLYGCCCLEYGTSD